LHSSYAASKLALLGFFDSLRAENHQNNISVTFLWPAFINSNISKNALIGNGAPQGKMAVASINGMPPEHCAKLMLRAIIKKNCVLVEQNKN
jgi:dehydrogenase/reductase SDR family protein 7B